MNQQFRFKSKFLPWLLVLPQFIILVVFFLYPGAQALFQSLFIQDAFGLSQEFVGFENFIHLWSDSVYLESIFTSIGYGFSVCALVQLFSLILVWQLAQIRKGALLYRYLLLIPYAISPAIGSVLWLFLFNPNFGIIPDLLAGYHIGWNHVVNPFQALLLILIIAVWKQIPYNILFLGLAISSISPSLLEAAAVDGAGPRRRFYSLVLPAISPTLLYLTTMNLAFAFFDTFAIIHQTTHGGPENTTTTLVYKVFKDGFLGMDQGYSAAQSVVLILFMSIIAIFQFRRMEEKITYF